MDYEKAYKEALSRANKYYNANTNKGYREIFEDIFPELRESEDERIRNEIILYIGSKDIDLSTHNRWLTWLEKQGEHKCDCKYVGCYVNDVKRWCHKKQAEIFYEKCNTECSDYLKQGEQKPIWSEEDKEIIKKIIESLQRYMPTDELSEEQEMIAWLKSLKDRVQPQLTQEWNEEDEEMYKEVLTDIIYAKNDLKTKGCLGLSNRAMKAFNWFSKRHKSLRPQSKWKPSEEQMQAIKYFIDFHRPQANASTEGWSEFKHLESLYNNLKKL